MTQLTVDMKQEEFSAKIVNRSFIDAWKWMCKHYYPNLQVFAIRSIIRMQRTHGKI